MYSFNYNTNKHGSKVVFVNCLNAPELQKVYLRDSRGNLHQVARERLKVPASGWFTSSNKVAVRVYRGLHQARNRVGRHCWIEVALPDGLGVQHYNGYVSSYAAVLQCVHQLKQCHNLKGTTFKVRTEYICG